jgi:hypothetical protein
MSSRSILLDLLGSLTFHDEAGHPIACHREGYFRAFITIEEHRLRLW